MKKKNQYALFYFFVYVYVCIWIDVVSAVQWTCCHVPYTARETENRWVTPGERQIFFPSACLKGVTKG